MCQHHHHHHHYHHHQQQQQQQKAAASVDSFNHLARGERARRSAMQLAAWLHGLARRWWSKTHSVSHSVAVLVV